MKRTTHTPTMRISPEVREQQEKVAIDALRYPKTLTATSLPPAWKGLQNYIAKNGFMGWEPAVLVIYEAPSGGEMGIGELRAKNNGFGKYSDIIDKFIDLADEGDIGPSFYNGESMMLEKGCSIMVGGNTLNMLKSVFASMPERVFFAPPSHSCFDDFRTGVDQRLKGSIGCYDVIDNAIHRDASRSGMLL